MPIAIKVENLSKAYRLGQIGTGTLTSDLNRWYAKVRGKEDPFLKIGETNDRTVKGTSDIVWSLKDINFEIEQGDAVGIIGRNGAGKSTLLKILSKITSPTTGKISGNGRIASLLEVGTGFNPELTGKDNIYLNGAILGMRKKEITRKFDEIVSFAGVERYIDTPVKRYSSGMYVRLAFAVAAYLESEILIVDEVLAVGDADFQKKCLGKMNEVSKGEGRTVLFVSHNMSSIQNLCTKGIYLKNGLLDYAGNVRDSISKYNSEGIELIQIPLKDRKQRTGNGNVFIQDFFVLNDKGKKTDILKSGNDYRFIIAFKNNLFPQNFDNVVASFALKDDFNQTTLLVRTNFTNQNIKVTDESGLICCFIKDLALTSGTYYATVFLGFQDIEIYDLVEEAIKLEVDGGDFFGTGSIGLPTHCKILTHSEWSLLNN